MTLDLHYFSVATKYHPNLDLLMSLSKHFALDIQLIGKHDSQLTQWGTCFGKKIHYYHEALQTVPKESLVLLSDSYDFLPLVPKREIIDKFLELDCDILYNAEFYCHPIPQLWTKYDELLPLNKDKRYRYLNSGGILGYAGKILELMNHYPYNDDTDDQGYHTKALLDIVENKTLEINIKLDTQNHIFFCMAGNIGKLRFDTEMLRYQCSDTDGWPKCCHMNGSIGETRPTFDKWNEYHKIPVERYEF